MLNNPQNTSKLGLSGLLLLSSLAFSGSENKAVAASTPQTPAGRDLSELLSAPGFDGQTLPLLAGRAEASKSEAVDLARLSAARSHCSREFHYTPDREEVSLLNKLKLLSGTPEQQAEELLSIFQAVNRFHQASGADRQELQEDHPGRYRRLEERSRALQQFKLADDHSSQGLKTTMTFLMLCRSVGVHGIAMQMNGHFVAGLDGDFSGDAVMHNDTYYYIAEPSYSGGYPGSKNGSQIGQYPYDRDDTLELALDLLPFDQTLTVSSSTRRTRIELSSDDVLLTLDKIGDSVNPSFSEKGLQALRKIHEGGRNQKAAEKELADQREKGIHKILSVNSPAITKLAHALTDDLPDKETKAAALLGWVQSHITYSEDTQSFGALVEELFQPPFLTVFHGRGECLDMTVLLAALYKSVGIDSVILLIPGTPWWHAAAAVAGDFQGSSVLIDGKRYYFAETTNPDAGIGEMLEKYEGATTYVVRTK